MLESELTTAASQAGHLALGIPCVCPSSFGITVWLPCLLSLYLGAGIQTHAFKAVTLSTEPFPQLSLLPTTIS